MLKSKKLSKKCCHGIVFIYLFVLFFCFCDSLVCFFTTDGAERSKNKMLFLKKKKNH
jgi:hypothetical protein